MRAARTPARAGRLPARPFSASAHSLLAVALVCCLAAGVPTGPVGASGAIMHLPGAPMPGVQAPTVTVHGTVFIDADASGAQEPGETGLAGVRITDGRSVFATGADGSFSITVERVVARFVVMTVPRGYRSTGPFYHRLGEAEEQTTHFGLIADASGDLDAYTFVHASDPQVVNADGREELLAALEEIDQLQPPAQFVVITGDLVHTSRESQFEQVAAALDSSPLTIYPAFGDHDADRDGLRVRSYEQWFGPTCYSFERGGYHCVIFNDVASVSEDGSFPQYDWLEADVAAASGRVLLFMHFLPGREELDRYIALGVEAVFSGHWHANRERRLDGMLDFNTAPIRYAGIDRSARGFRLVELGTAAIASEVRSGGLESQLTVMHPVDGDVVPFGKLPLRVAAYDTRYPDLQVRYRLTDAAGQITAGDLSAAGGWSYNSGGELTTLGSDTYTLTVEAEAAGTLVASRTIDFEVQSLALPVRLDGAPWPGFRGNPLGTGVTSDALTLPLQYAWATHVGGPTGLSSPVTAGGRVFLAHTTGRAEAAALVAFDGASGTEIWRHPTGGEVKGTPAVADGRVVVITADGEVQAVDAALGVLLWSVQLGEPAERFDVTSPTIADGGVYVGGPSVTAALDAATGAIRWQRSLARNDFLATIYSAPVVDAEQVIVALYSGLYVLDRATGETVWSRAASSREAHRSAALAGGTLFAAGDNFGSQRLRALDPENGAELWSAPYSVGNANSAPAVTADAVVLGTSNGKVMAFARATGEALWTYSIGEAITSGVPYQRTAASVTASPVVSGSLVLVGADDGRLHVIDASSGAALWTRELGAPIRSSAAASGNQIWVATTDGVLVSFVAGAPSEVGVSDVGAAAQLGARIGVVHPNPMPGGGWLPIRIGAPTSGGDRGQSGVAARLQIYDVAGRRIRTLVDGVMQEGDHRLYWDGRDSAGRRVAAGVYFLRLESGEVIARSRLTVIH